MKRLVARAHLRNYSVAMFVVQAVCLTGVIAVIAVLQNTSVRQDAPTTVSVPKTPPKAVSDKKVAATTSQSEGQTNQAQTEINNQPQVQVQATSAPKPQSVPASPDPAPAQSIRLYKVSNMAYMFETANFYSASYLWVLEPVSTMHPQDILRGDYGFSAVSPGLGTYPRQTGAVTVSNIPAGISSGDTYKLYICANVGGGCGLRSNVLNGVAVMDQSSLLYIVF